MRPAQLLLAALLTLSLAAAGSGCKDACDELSDLICDCEPNSTEQASCRETVKSMKATRTPSPDELQYCEDHLESCTCDSIEDGNLIACGIGKPR